VRYSPRLSPGSISVLDLGHAPSAHCNLIASVGLEAEYDHWGPSPLTVRATPDGRGLLIFLSKM
jgi:hypothetical protein